MSAGRPALSWFGIVRLGLVQTALGSIFVLSTSTLNRVMVIELSLPAVLPGLLIGLHYLMQVLRPCLGHRSDVGGRRTPWIVGGMAVLALGGVGAAAATGLMAHHLAVGLILAVASFVLIGGGVGSCGTALLVLLAERAAPARRAAAAAVAWVMMIAGFILTAALAGHFLDPFSPGRLLAVAAAISGTALLVSCVAVWGVEGRPASQPAEDAGAQGFRRAMREVWAEPRSRRFATFIFVSMLAYGGEDLLIEPFAGACFGLTPGATAKLSGLLHGGTLLGMLLVAVSSMVGGSGKRALELWMTGGCVASGAALAGIAGCGFAGAAPLLGPLLLALGAANGAYAIAAIGSMMQLVGAGGPGRGGVRMGLWGAAQALAFGGGGLAATVLNDVAHRLIAGPAGAYGAVFTAEAAVFLYATTFVAGLGSAGARSAPGRCLEAVPTARAERG